jgi:hypothetical protein
MSAPRYARRGIAFESRYLVAWTGTTSTAKRGLRSSFDDLEEARRFIASRPDAVASGVWNRRANRWEEVAE